MRTTILAALLLLTGLSMRAQSWKEAPLLNLKDIHGRSVSLAKYRGKVVLVNFWATWCPPCRKEIPDLIKIQRQYQKDGLRIIGITYPPQRIFEIRRFVRKFGMNYPVAMGTKASKGLFASGETLPMTVVIDRDGTIHDVIEGILYLDEFDQKVKPLILNQPAKQR